MIIQYPLENPPASSFSSRPPNLAASRKRRNFPRLPKIFCCVPTCRSECQFSLEFLPKCRFLHPHEASVRFSLSHSPLIILIPKFTSHIVIGLHRTPSHVDCVRDREFVRRLAVFQVNSLPQFPVLLLRYFHPL